MTTTSRRRRGVVLASALYYLAALALLIVGTVYASRGARIGATGTVSDAMLAGAIDHAFARRLADWNAPARAKQPVGSAASIEFETVREVIGTASITRLGPSLYWVAVESRSANDAAARRRATLIVRALVPQPLVRASIVSQGDVIVGVQARIVADTTTPEDCPTPPAVSLALAPDATLQREGAADTITTIRLVDAARDETFDRFGTESFATLASNADVRLPADTSLAPTTPAHGTCVTARATDDWSDRTAADGCVVAPPIVFAAGDLTITGGSGTGLLLVQGRLRVTGPFTFTGAIVARGGVEITGDGTVITGSVLAARLTTTSGVTPGASLVVSGRTLLHASPCAAYRVFASRSGVRSVHARAWLERF